MSKLWKFLAVGAVGAFAVAPSTFAANGGNDSHGPTGYSKGVDAEGQNVRECAEGTGSTDDEDPDTIDFVGETNSWPPNHRDVAASIIADGDEGDAITLAAVATSNDTSMDPDDFDFMGPGTGTSRVVAGVTTARERAGYTDQDSGRVYTIDVTATFDGTECTAQFCTRTPHDMRRTNRTWVPCQDSYPDPGPATA
jgi:hypothetical protein